MKFQKNIILKSFKIDSSGKKSERKIIIFICDVITVIVEYSEKIQQSVFSDKRDHSIALLCSLAAPPLTYGQNHCSFMLRNPDQWKCWVQGSQETNTLMSSISFIYHRNWSSRFCGLLPHIGFFSCFSALSCSSCFSCSMFLDFFEFFFFFFQTFLNKCCISGSTRTTISVEYTFSGFHSTPTVEPCELRPFACEDGVIHGIESRRYVIIGPFNRSLRSTGTHGSVALTEPQEYIIRQCTQGAALLSDRY